MKKKPSWFTLLDLLTIAGPGVAILGLFVYGMIVGVSGEHAKQGLWLTGLVGLSFIAIWVRILFGRKAALAKYTWYPTYGLMVDDDGGKYHLPGNVLLDAEVGRTIQAWSPYYKATSLLSKDADVFWVYFRKGLDETDKNLAHRKVEGFTVSGTHVLYIDYDSADQPIEKTALSHELGHVILGEATNNWDLETHHKYMKDHGLR